MQRIQKMKQCLKLLETKEFGRATRAQQKGDVMGPIKKLKMIDELAGDFATACYDQNTLRELQAPHREEDADKTDCRNWGITPAQWSAGIAAALAERLADQQGMSDSDELDENGLPYPTQSDCALGIIP